MELAQSTLLAHLTQVPDPRSAQGQRFVWSFLWAIAAAAVLAGQTTVTAIAAWAQAHRQELLAALQPAKPRLPSQATLRRLLSDEHLQALEQQVAAHNQSLDEADALAGSLLAANGQRLRAQAVDGKDVHGPRAHGQPLFLVSAVRHVSAYVLGQAAVDQKTNEITVVPGLLAQLDLTGTVTTLDALLTQQALARQIHEQGGHYLMIVKENQPALYEAIELLFRTPPVPARPGERLSDTRRDKGHGRLETRTVACSTALAGYLDWPYAEQVLCRTCRRLILKTGAVQEETHYAVSDLSRTWAGPQQFEQLWRGHWTIENKVHYVRDETLGEDRNQSHSGSTPQVLAALRNATLSLLRYHGWTNIAAAIRHYANDAHKALQLIGAIAT